MKNDPPPKPKNDGSKPESTKRHVYVEPGVKIDLVKDLKEKYETAQGDSTTHSNKVLFWTKISAALLLVYVSLTAIQTWLIKHQFVEDQRPYVWFNSELPSIQANQPIIWNVIYQNYGRSPAFKLRSCVGLLVRPKPERLPLDASFKNHVPPPSFDSCVKRAEDENRSLQPPGGKTVASGVSYGYLPDSDAVNVITHAYVGILVIE